MYCIINRLKTVAALLLLMVCASSCIYDHYHTTQFNIHIHAVDDNGKRLPDYAIQGQHLYFFIDERYSAELYPDANGNYFSSFPEGTVVQFVSVASEDSTAFRFNTPVTGDHIHEWYAEVLDYNYIPPLYYGSTILQEGSDNVQIVMKDIRCRFRVLVRNLKNKMGDGSYKIGVSGLRKAITYEGQGCGDLIDCMLIGAMQGDGNWISETKTVLPTAPNEGISIRLYQNDNVVFYSDVDDEGNLMQLHAGDDVCFVVTLWDKAAISIRVVPWSEVYQSFEI